MNERYRKLGKIGALAFGASALLSACGGAEQPKPTENKDLHEAMRGGVTITEGNFGDFFTKCKSEQELIDVARSQGKEMFPIVIPDPASIKIVVEPQSSEIDSFDVVTVSKPVGIISPIDGRLIPEEGARDVLTDNITFLGVDDYSIEEHSVAFGPDGNIKTEIGFELFVGTEMILFKDVTGDHVKRGDPVFRFDSSPQVDLNPYKEFPENEDIVAPNTFILKHVNYNGADINTLPLYTSNLSETFAAKDGRILYCSESEIPIPNSQTNPLNMQAT